MIKPTAMCHLNAILDRIQKEGFKIITLKVIRVSEKRAKIFYDIHKEKSWFDEIIKSITKDKVAVMVLQKENAVEDFRKLIGNKDPNLAEEGTIRKEFGVSLNDNGIHGSDSDMNARREMDVFFIH